MARYKVCYEGFAYVEADNEEEARENYENGYIIYGEEEINEVKKIRDFFINI